MAVYTKRAWYAAFPAALCEQDKTSLKTSYFSQENLHLSHQNYSENNLKKNDKKAKR